MTLEFVDSCKRLAVQQTRTQNTYSLILRQAYLCLLIFQIFPFFALLCNGVGMQSNPIIGRPFIQEHALDTIHLLSITSPITLSTGCYCHFPAILTINFSSWNGISFALKNRGASKSETVPLHQIRAIISRHTNYHHYISFLSS